MQQEVQIMIGCRNWPYNHPWVTPKGRFDPRGGAVGQIEIRFTSSSAMACVASWVGTSS